MSKTASLKQALHKKHKATKKKFARKHQHAKEWFDKREFSLSEIRKHSAKLLTGATLSSALLLSSPHLPLITGSGSINKTLQASQELMQQLQQINSQAFSQQSEQTVEKGIKKLYGVRAVFELDQNRLPTYYGSMGLEQHLIRFPGDTLNQHEYYIRAGIAPHRGAFGYFSQEGKSIETTKQQEAYYIVLQTFVIPNWERDWARLKEWYKFRKFLVINPSTGKGVVAVLGDSGPAVWTGKQFGGSPEVMADLGYYPGKTKGDVVVLYLDDSGDEIPLGPINIKN